MNDKYIKEFTRAYITTALWATTDENDEPLDANWSESDLTAECHAEMESDCRTFIEQNAGALDDDNCLKYGPDFGPAGRAGHDFWLTRNRHGAGFWDGDWEESAGKKLTDAAHACGERHLYVFENRIHIGRG